MNGSKFDHCMPILSLFMHHQFLALQVLEKFIQTRWKVLPADNRNGKKLAEYVVEYRHGIDNVLHSYPLLHRQCDCESLIRRNDPCP
jgi:hypothetical protein